MLLDHITRDHLIRVIHKVFQQSKLLWRQIDGPARTLNTVNGRINYQVSYLPVSLFRGLLATKQDAQTCKQLTHGKRLYQIIVRTTIQTLHTIIDAIACSQQQKRSVNPALA